MVLIGAGRNALKDAFQRTIKLVSDANCVRYQLAYNLARTIVLCVAPFTHDLSRYHSDSQ